MSVVSLVYKKTDSVRRLSQTLEGSWKTVYSRFRKWIDDGILDNIFRILSLEAELEELSIDASIIQAHQHSAGAKKGGLQMKSGIAVEKPAPKSMRQ